MNRARDILAGEVASSGKRPAMEVADRMLERLAAAGLQIVPTDGYEPPAGTMTTQQFAEAIQAMLTRVRIA